VARKLVLEACSCGASIFRTQRIHTYPYWSRRRSHLNCAKVNLSTHIADIVNLVQWENLRDFGGPQNAFKRLGLKDIECLAMRTFPDAPLRN
jgi:hypothetical protein